MATFQVSIERVSIVSSKPFEDVLERLASQIGHPDMSAFSKAVAAAESYAALEKIVQEAVGPYGLMEFTRFNLGEILSKESGDNSPPNFSVGRRQSAHHEANGRSRARCRVVCAGRHLD